MGQVDPDQMRTVLHPYFVTKNEFYDRFIHQSLMMPLFQALPALRGFWPGSSAGVRKLIDLSGNDQDFTLNPSGFEPRHSVTSGTPFIEFDGVNDYGIITDSSHWDIIGTETYVASAIRGLTVGAWVYFDDTPSATEYILAKRQEADTEISYMLYRDGSGYPIFGVSSDGLDAGKKSVTGTTIIPAGQWTFVVGRFDPSTELSIFANVSEDLNTTSIPASIYSGAADLLMASRDDSATPGQGLMDGRISMAFICAAYISDYVLLRLYEISRIVYGVD